LISVLNEVQVQTERGVEVMDDGFDDGFADDAFEEMDVDQDGQLSTAELGKALKRARVCEADVARIIEQFDVNKDGNISEEEYDGMCVKLMNDTKAPAAIKKWITEITEFPKLEKRSKEWLDKEAERILKPVPENQSPPSLIVPYGPCGSGKTGATNQSLKRKGILKEHCIDLNIDNCVRSYMKEVLGIDDRFKNSEIYFAVRAGWPRKLKTFLLDHAKKTKRHIIIETTGTSTNLTGLVKDVADKGYNVVIVYPIVPWPKIVPRVMGRKRMIGQGHPPLHSLALTCRQAGRNLFDYVQSGGETCDLIFANNNGSEGTEHLVPNKDPELRKMALSEPYQAELTTLLIQHSVGKFYHEDALRNDFSV